VPPIATVETIDVNQRIVIIQHEETANIGNIQPHTNIFYELNCSERMLREHPVWWGWLTRQAEPLEVRPTRGERRLIVKNPVPAGVAVLYACQFSGVPPRTAARV
jgi:hypothetical protein